MPSAVCFVTSPVSSSVSEDVNIVRSPSVQESLKRSALPMSFPPPSTNLDGEVLAKLIVRADVYVPKLLGSTVMSLYPFTPSVTCLFGRPKQSSDSINGACTRLLRLMPRIDWQNSMSQLFLFCPSESVPDKFIAVTFPFQNLCRSRQACV